MKAHQKTDWKLALYIVTLAAPLSLLGQPLEVSNAPPITPENLITNIFLGEGVEVLNVQFQGSSSAVGFFQNGDDEVGLGRGIVMSTGYAVSAPGIIGVDASGGIQASESASGPAADPDMQALSGTTDINDLVSYTITFIPISDTLRFRYVFASEEYPEYVCSDFNDVFGFFISGPGINGPFSGNAENIALIPETSLPVAINNVNPGVVGANGTVINCTPPSGSLAYSQYYNNNNGSANRPVFDGLTDVFTAEAVVFPCSTYTIKLVICDVADELFDSGVFLEAKSFGTGSLNVKAATVSLDGSVAEGCTQGELVFSLPVPAESNYPIDYRILGTAENGVDYEFVPPGLFIPAGDSILSIPIIAFDDGIPEGTETIIIDVQRDPCNRDTIVIPIKENILLKPELRTDTSVCPGSPVLLDGTVNVPVPEPPSFHNEDTLVISPHNVTLYSDVNVFGVLPADLGPGVIRSVCIEDLQTTWVDDLRIFLISPGGQFLELVTDIGNAGDNFIGTCFTPLATTPITSLGVADQPFTGEFAPEGLWEDLYGDGRPTNGTWRLVLFDKFFADTPVLNRWSITFTPLYEIKYSWQPSAGLSCTDCPAPQANPDSTATYILTAADSYGCESYDTVTIEVLPVLEAPQLACAAVTDNSITVSWPNVTDAMGYEVNVDDTGWVPANGANTHTVTGLTLSTTVHFQVRAVGPCGSLTASIECTTPNCVPPTLLVNSITDASCFGSADGGFTLSASDGTPPYQFVANGQTNSSGIFNGLPAGTYLVQAIDAAGCPVSQQVMVNQPDSLQAEQVIDPVSCIGLADGRATLDITGGIGPFTFSWSDGQIDSVATGLTAGNYQLFVTDANGCSTSFDVEVGEPAALEIVVATDSMRCTGVANGRATVAATGGSGNYTFDFGAGILIGTSPNHAVGLSAGSYAVTVTDSRGCEAVANYDIGEPLPLQSQLSATDALCSGDASATVSAVVSGGTGAYTYTWRDASMDIVAFSAVQSNLPAGQYFLEVVDENGCGLTDTITAFEPSALAYQFAIQPASCPGVNDGIISLQISGGTPGYTYNWNDIGNGPATRTGLATGNYTIMATDLNGCLLSIEVEVESPQPIELDFTTTPVSCVGNTDGQATVQPSGGSGGYSYSWADGQSTPTATGLSSGPILVVVTDDNGCQASGIATVEAASVLSLQLDGTAPACFGSADGSATAIAQGGAGGYSYLWSNGQAGATATGLSSGPYLVTVTDGNGCSALDSLFLTGPDILTSTIDVETATCNPDPDGSALANVQGGTPPYNYLWSNGQSQAAAVNLAMGTYILTITDANGCLLADTAVVSGIAPVRLSLEKMDVSCNGGGDGSVAAFAEGGSGAYVFNWSTGGSSGPQITNLTAGNYSVTVSDELGCTAMASIAVGEPSSIVLVAEAGRVSCAGDMDGSILATVSAGTPPYSIRWSTGDTTLAANGLGVGLYSVTVTDANGCQASQNAQVVEASPIDVSIETEDATCYGEASGSASVQAIGGLPPLSYQWDNGTTGPVLENAPGGNYTLSITDAAGCEVVEEVVVGQPLGPLAATVTPVDVSCFGKDDGRLEIEASGGTPFYRYSLDGDFFSGSNIFIGLEPSTYTVYIRDIRGCIFRASQVSIEEPEPIVVELGETRAVGFGTGIQLFPEITGGVGTLFYAWESQDTSILDCFDCFAPTATVTSQASIELTVTDSDGCTGKDIVTVYPQKDRPIFVPTGFTPNGDSSNDRLLVHAKEDIEILVLYFRIYDRWGELLFESGEFSPNDEGRGWDGTFRGQPVQGGVYIWHVGVEFVDGNKEEYSGHTTLIR